MTDFHNSDPEVLQPAEIPGESALAFLESSSSGLPPAQRELRRMVLDSVPAASSKLSYGHALDRLFGLRPAGPSPGTCCWSGGRRWRPCRHRQ